MNTTNSNLAIIVDLDDYGRICDFNIEYQSKIEVCDKSEPTKIKVGLELNPKTLTKSLTIGDAILNFNMIVRTARARRKNRNKRKPNSDVIEAELERIKKMKRDENVFDEIEEDSDPDISQQQIKEIPQIVQEEIIIENAPDTSIVYQCPIDECNDIFESTEDWQKHYFERHQEGKSSEVPIRVTVARTLDSLPDHKNEIELELESDETYVFAKCTSCQEPITQLDPVDDQTNGLCYFCQYQKNQKSSNVETFELNLSQQQEEHAKTSQVIYRCPVCYSSFSTNKTLADHMRVSCKIKWMNCDNCSHIAVSENELKKHRERVHGVTT